MSARRFRILLVYCGTLRTPPSAILASTPNEFRSEGVPPHVPLRGHIFAQLGLSAQADRRPKAPSHRLRVGGVKALDGPLEVCQQYRFNSMR